MHSAKKKCGKSEKVPKPIKIKKEKTEDERTMTTMSHYIDDRLELVKQIFGTLKPKTIINLAPDFLKNKDMDTIEELCLNELLGISTKRLLSVINATKCPTDTESSSDSDVEHQEEHISLEEISSDSEIDDSSKVKRKTSKANTKKNTKTNESGKNGHISVLELLELQARARAIRSQLALEPVTKIEVDSDTDEPQTNIIAPPPQQLMPSRTKRKSLDNKVEARNSKPRPSKTTSLNGTQSVSVGKATDKPLENATKTTKKIKLKRNFQVNQEDNKDENSKTIAAPPIEAVKMEKERLRSLSPDVIPIVNEPEIVYISDNSDNEAGAKANSSKVDVQNKLADNNSIIETLLPCKAKETSAPKEKKDVDSSTETEEGEITEGDSDSEDNNKTSNSNHKKNKNNSVTLDKKDMPEKPIQATQQPAMTKRDSSRLIEAQINVDSKSKSDCNENELEKCPKLTKSKRQLRKQLSQASHGSADNSKFVTIEEDPNEDIISIEGGDLESVMNEHLNEDSSTVDSVSTQTKDSDAGKQPDGDIIALDTSEEETDKLSSESWHSRYLKSSKVSKVLAASRLGKRVRDKIKSNQNALKQKTASEEDEKKKSANVFVSKHEDGSIEQYKELIEMNQRKSKE